MSGKSVWGQPLFFWCCASSLMFWGWGGGSCQGTWLMRGWRAARCVGYPIPSARAAVRKVPLGGDNTLDRDVGKIRGPCCGKMQMDPMQAFGHRE